MKEKTVSDRKKITGNILKWVLIIGLLAFGCIKNRKFMAEAFVEVADTPAPKVLLCLLAANLYFAAEGMIISKMTATGEKRLTPLQGISCSYMCAFYRLATLGSGNGIAQVYYYNTKGIDVSRGTGMAISQYTFQKITIGVMGVASYLFLIAQGDRELLQYSGYMLIGVALISLVCLFLFVITVSRKISDWVMKLARKIVKENSKLYPKLQQGQNAIDHLQEQGRIIWHDKKLFFQVVFLNVFKFACWYAIPGILFFHEYKIAFIVSLTLMAVCNMLGCVMLAPSGVGTLDFVFAIFFGAVIPEGEAVAAAIMIYRFFTWVVPFIIGLVPAVLLKNDKKALSHQ